MKIQIHPIRRDLRGLQNLVGEMRVFYLDSTQVEWCAELVVSNTWVIRTKTGDAFEVPTDEFLKFSHLFLPTTEV